jgi:hypothetical protein
MQSVERFITDYMIGVQTLLGVRPRQPPVQSVTYLFPGGKAAGA